MSKYQSLVHSDDAEYTQITPRLRMRNHGSWLIRERKGQDRIAKDRSRQLLAVVQLAKRIAADKGIEIDDAFMMINGADGSNASITADYIDEIGEIVESASSQTESDAQILTLFLKSRAEGFISEQWKRLSDWSTEDTDVLDDGTREKIVAFINKEQAGGSSVNDDDDEDAADENTEGNEKENSTSGSKRRSTASESSSNATTGTAATQESPLVA
jgi:hypothetical protein